MLVFTARLCPVVLSDVQGYLGATGIFALCFDSGYIPTEREEENCSVSLFELHKYLLKTRFLMLRQHDLIYQAFLLLCNFCLLL